LPAARIWRSETSKTLFLVRHGEALKNVADRHGGPGTGLTARGHEEMRAAATTLRQEIKTRPAVFGHSVPQVLESLQIIEQTCGWTATLDDRLRGLDLGVLAGLSKSAAAAAYPEPAKRLELWRMGKLMITELDLPASEPIECFWRRVSEALAAALGREEQDVVMVMTRSTLILVTNLLHLDGRFSYEAYKPHSFVSGSVVRWRVSNARPEMLP
jgi:broad specificity phosphatase PhoE